jgi:UvrD-like helicase C-terminal domain/Nuclease-related domain
MALMIPDEVQSFTTEGEGKFYRFLSAAAKPDNSYLAWYLPNIHGKEPDFILYSDSVGLVIFEVKDWALDQIREASPHQFTLAIKGEISPRKNPLQQARDYIGELKDKIKADGKLISNNPAHHGNPRIPINFGVVFPNINKFEYVDKNLQDVIPTEKVFFWDDLHPASDICSDPTGKCFLKTLNERFSPVFKFAASQRDVLHLKQLLFPEVRIDLPNRAGQGGYAEQAERLKVLDHNQEALARQFDGGHRIIVGASGSGKTLVLAHKAGFLQRYNPAIKSILFVCYNITLVNFVKRILAGKGIPIGEAGVTVCHFYELCSWITGESIPYEKEDNAFYEMVAQEALAKVGSYAKRFDAILVDEGQDFTPEMFKVVTGLLNPTTNNLTIALDGNQNIYRPKAQWKELGIQARGRVHKLTSVYRNTAEIAGFAARFLGNKGGNEEKTDAQLKLFEDFYDFHGPAPELCRFETLDRMAAGVAEKAAAVVKADGCPFSEIAVLFALKKPDKKRADSLPEMVEAALEKQGILSQWMSENYRSKKAYDITTDRVTISTIHSAKGLDYSVVFLLGLDFLAPKGWSEEQIANLTYVGITRARYRLIIPYINETPLIDRIQKALAG